MLSRSARPHRSPRPITAPEFWNSPSPGAGGRCAFRAGPAFEFTARRGATTVPGIRHAVFATRQPRNRRGTQCRPVLRSRGRRGDRSLWRHTLTTLWRENPPTGCRRARGRWQRNSIGFPATAACGHGRRPRRHPLGQPLRASHPGAACSIGGPTATRPTGVAIASGHRDGRADQPAYKWRGMGPIAMRGCACTPRLMTVAVGFHQLIRWS
jgi:hypothetical protein